MVLSKRVARFNRVVTNRVGKRVAGSLPGFGIVAHRGRRSGKEYRTPVNVFRRDGAYVVALTYGPDADWVKNVLADGGCVLHTRGRAVRLYSPEVVHDESRGAMPPGVRQFLGVIAVRDFLWLAEHPPAA
ncbi:nitroreductase family deazaflavin-dependent oxidoreductase [Amycolatopsis sp. CA-230715]|uniref:nitroreductase family deazaflavin-dependent oxidoreductase n=1 Tax=Amycolatopsis sp. CA-230715 TaxID=2745196 RepID=UPI001C01AE8C|nr:nitroreductase family deazaflavin-dependent oxidoreductase [Amycolatopsis sp. CA-230715]QWF84649.1 hypothetical protein HUW46_08100 [Amycolatopsis sp. CA-230715]